MLSTKQARQLFALHRWMGLWTGIFILFLSVTGSVLVFKVEIDRWLNPGLLVSTPDGTGGVSPDSVLASLQGAFPGSEFGGLFFPSTPSGVYSAYMDMDGVYTEITVDRYSGEVLGTRDYRASFGDVMRQLHLRFYAFSWYGRVVVGLFGVTLVVSSVTGLLIYGRFIKALPRWWSIRRDRGLQISSSDWHKLIGIVSLAFNLVIAVTGAVLGLENLTRFAPAAGELIHPGPTEAQWAAMEAEAPASLEGAMPLSDVLVRAGAAIPGLRPTTVSLPTPDWGYYEVYGEIEGRIQRSNVNQVIMQAVTGEVMYIRATGEGGLVTRAYDWMDPLHYGYFGGIWTKVLWALLGLTSGVLAITGFMLIWLKRRRSRKPAVPRTGGGSSGGARGEVSAATG